MLWHRGTESEPHREGAEGKICGACMKRISARVDGGGVSDCGLTLATQSIKKRKTSNANGQTNLGHKHKAPDHNHEATQPMVDLPHTS